MPDVHLVGPRTLLQPELEAMGVKVHYDLKEAIQDADVINVLRIQKERQGIGRDDVGAGRGGGELE